MTKGEQVVRVYEDLAYQYDRQGQARLRDCFLMLAADAAFESGWEDEAERLRIQLLSFNPHHLLRPYPSFADALRSPDIQSYLEDLRQTHPPEDAERQLRRRQPGETSLSQGGAHPASRPAEPTSPVPHANGKNEEPPVYKLREVATESGPVRPVAPSARPAPTPRPGILATPPTRAAAPPVHANKTSVPIRGVTSPLPFAGSAANLAPAPPSPEEPGAAGRLFSTFLFVLLLVAGLALGIYTLVGPFLPRLPDPAAGQATEQGRDRHVSGTRGQVE